MRDKLEQAGFFSPKTEFNYSEGLNGTMWGKECFPDSWHVWDRHVRMSEGTFESEV